MSLVAAFWGVSFLFVITPGADWAYALTAGLRHRSVAPAVGGLLSGHVAATVMVAAGVAAVVAQTAGVLTAITITGAGYLVWLGYQTLTGPASPHTGEQAGQPVGGSWPRQAARGAAISGLNPKVFLLFLALLPQFTDPDSSWPLATQIVLLGMVHVTSCAIVYTAVALCARRVLTIRPNVARAVVKVSGVAMALIGTGLLIEQVVS